MASSSSSSSRVQHGYPEPVRKPLNHCNAWDSFGADDQDYLAPELNAKDKDGMLTLQREETLFPIHDQLWKLLQRHPSVGDGTDASLFCPLPRKNGDPSTVVLCLAFLLEFVAAAGKSLKRVIAWKHRGLMDETCTFAVETTDSAEACVVCRVSPFSAPAAGGGKADKCIRVDMRYHQELREEIVDEEEGPRRIDVTKDCVAMVLEGFGKGEVVSGDACRVFYDCLGCFQNRSGQLFTLMDQFIERTDGSEKHAEERMAELEKKMQEREAAEEAAASLACVPPPPTEAEKAAEVLQKFEEIQAQSELSQQQRDLQRAQQQPAWDAAEQAKLAQERRSSTRSATGKTQLGMLQAAIQSELEETRSMLAESKKEQKRKRRS